MSKTKTLFTMALLVLLGSMGAAQAQNFAEVKLFTTEEDFAREGGKNEAAGQILLNSSAEAALRAEGAMIMLHFSVPLAADIDATTQAVEATQVTVTGDTGAVVTGMAENEDNDGNGTITIDPTGGAGQNLLIEGVKLDVSDADGAVTVTLEVTAGEGDFIRIDGPSSAMVIGGIKVGVEASVETITVRTRGTGADGVKTSLTLKESFKGAFMTGNMVTVDSSGIPEGATLEAIVTSNLVANTTADPPVVIGEDTPYASAGAVKDGSVTVTLGGDDGAGNEMRPAPSSVTLELTLTAVPPDDDEEMLFPLARSSVMAKALFTDMQGGDDNFEDAFTDYVTVFNIRPAQCEILFPVVTVYPATPMRNAWETAISVTNPAFMAEMASGGLTFTFYPMGAEPVVYETEPGSPGSGLEADGTLAPGGTYQVLISQILSSTGWGDSFQGHVHLLADYTDCTGLGWVTDWAGVNQAYSAVVISADTGTDE